MDHLFSGFIRAALRRHLGEGFFGVLGTASEPLVLGSAVLWLLLFWLYRRKIFLRI